MTKRVYPARLRVFVRGFVSATTPRLLLQTAAEGFGVVFFVFLSSSKRFVHYENVSSSDIKQETSDSKDAGSCLNKQAADTEPASAHFRHLNALLMPVFLSAAAVEVISRVPSPGINKKNYLNMLICH